VSDAGTMFAAAGLPAGSATSRIYSFPTNFWDERGAFLYQEAHSLVFLSKGGEPTSSPPPAPSPTPMTGTATRPQPRWGGSGATTPRIRRRASPRPVAVRSR